MSVRPKKKSMRGTAEREILCGCWLLDLLERYSVQLILEHLNHSRLMFFFASLQPKDGLILITGVLKGNSLKTFRHFVPF